MWIESFYCVAHSIMKRTYFLNYCTFVCICYKNKNALCLGFPSVLLHRTLDFWYRNSSNCVLSPASNAAWFPVLVCSVHRGSSLYTVAPHRNCGRVPRSAQSAVLVWINHSWCWNLHLKKRIPSVTDTTLERKTAQRNALFLLVLMVTRSFVLFSVVKFNIWFKHFHPELI